MPCISHKKSSRQRVHSVHKELGGCDGMEVVCGNEGSPVSKKLFKGVHLDSLSLHGQGKGSTRVGEKRQHSGSSFGKARPHILKRLQSQVRNLGFFASVRLF